MLTKMTAAMNVARAFHESLIDGKLYYSQAVRQFDEIKKDKRYRMKFLKYDHDFCFVRVGRWDFIVATESNRVFIFDAIDSKRLLILEPLQAGYVYHI